MQAAIPVDTCIPYDIERTVSVVLSQRPFMESIVRPFAALFMEKAFVSSALREDLYPTDSDFGALQRRSDEGIPILTAFPFASLEPALDRAFAALVPVAKSCFPVMFMNLERIEFARACNRFKLGLLSEGYLDGSLKGLVKRPFGREVTYPNVGFVIHLVLSAALQSIRPFLTKKTTEAKWRRGYCPVCGMLPSISFIPAPPERAETSRYFHCALCGYDWPIRDGLCAACERESTEQRITIRLQDENSEKADICSHCGHYLPCIDLRETRLPIHLDTMAVGMAHLDFMAQEKGFSPMVQAPWNTFR